MGQGIAVRKPTLQKPSKVERARMSLDEAVARLETAVARRRDEGDADGAVSAAELEGLRDENVRLKALNETVAERLDATIGRLKVVIGG